MKIAFVGGKIIDGKGGTLDGSVVIEKDKIVEVCSGREFGSEVHVVDLAGKTIMPGLVDCHRHFGEWFQWLVCRDESEMYLAAKTVRALKNCLEAGCTTARDMGGLEAGFRDAVEDGLIPGPRLQTALVIIQATNGLLDNLPGLGRALTPQGYFATIPGIPAPWCDGPHEARKKVREVLRLGGDVIKIANDGVPDNRTRWDRTLFTDEELEAIVDEAHRAGVTVGCHAYSTRAVLQAVRAGIDSIEDHGELDQECCDEMAKRNTWLLTCFSNLHYHAEYDTVPENREHASQAIADGAGHADLMMALRSGVRVAMATDTGFPTPGDPAREPKWLVEAGMTPMQALHASTGLAAECLRMDDRVGTLEAGKKADLLVIDGDPLSDINVLSAPGSMKLVMKDGKGVNGDMVYEFKL